MTRKEHIAKLKELGLVAQLNKFLKMTDAEYEAIQHYEMEKVLKEKRP